MDPRKVLVIIPTLERPEMCARAIRSLVAQQYNNWTAVIAKNGGNRYLSRYKVELGGLLNHPRITLYVLPERGLGYALNEIAIRFLGFNGSFAVLEDDDEWDPGFLPTMTRELMASGADVAHCLQRQTPKQKQSAGGPMHKERLKRQNWINFPMCLFRSRLYFETGGFSKEAGPATDWDWHLRCLKANAKYHFVPETLVTHYWHGSNYCTKVDGRPYIVGQMEQGEYKSE